MNTGITTSIRLPPKLRNQLDQASHNLHRGKNWIICRALEDYLMKLDRRKFIEEAQRQSLLASKMDNKENAPWDQEADDSGWI